MDSKKIQEIETAKNQQKKFEDTDLDCKKMAKIVHIGFTFGFKLQLWNSSQKKNVRAVDESLVSHWVSQFKENEFDPTMGKMVFMLTKDAHNSMIDISSK